MNAERRKKIGEIATLIENARQELETVRDEEQDYYDNMPESFQQGEKGNAAEEAIQLLSDGCDALDETVSNLRGME